MNTKTNTLLCAVVALAMAPLVHASVLTWVFQFDPTRYAKQVLQYTEENNKKNQMEQESALAEKRRQEMSDMEAQIGAPMQGNIALTGPGRADEIEKAARSLKVEQDERARTKEAGETPTGYDVYLARVATWRTQIEAYRVKTDALAMEANSRKMNLAGWMAMQTNYSLVLGETRIAAAAQANEQAEIKAGLLRERAEILEKIQEMKRMQTIQR